MKPAICTTVIMLAVLWAACYVWQFIDTWMNVPFWFSVTAIEIFVAVLLAEQLCDLWDKNRE